MSDNLESQAEDISNAAENKSDSNENNSLPSSQAKVELSCEENISTVLMSADQSEEVQKDLEGETLQTPKSTDDAAENRNEEAQEAHVKSSEVVKASTATSAEKKNISTEFISADQSEKFQKNFEAETLQTQQSADDAVENRSEDAEEAHVESNEVVKASPTNSAENVDLKSASTESNKESVETSNAQSTNSTESNEEVRANVDDTTTTEVAPSSTVESKSEIIVAETDAAKKVSETTELTESASANEKDHKTPSCSPTASTEEGVDVNYTQHMTYESDGSAIYIDPNTNYRYKWSTTENKWIPCDSTTNAASSDNNPYENDHYKWCSESQKWIPKVQAQTETEHYKWDAERKEWIAKENSSFCNDPANVTYDIDEDGQRIYTDKDGTVFFWDTTKKAWFPKIDDDFMAHYQMNYGFIDNTSASEAEKRRKAEEEEKRKELELQRMAEEAKAGAEAAAAGKAIKRKAPEPPKWFDVDPEQNTKVYVSNLPLDITLDEFTELMSKCGMIMRDPQTQKFKIKLYAEPNGQLKGDGLCDYIKVESVGLALNILDEYNLRGHKIRVQRAKFQMRGEYNPALKPKRKKKDKEKLQKMKEKLFDWRPEKMRGERSKNEKVVIIKNLFEPSIFEKEVQLILDYQNDLREECSKCGTVRKVVIYDRHPEGVAQINMADPEEADVVIQMMHGRYFGQRKLTAEHWDGKTKYKIVESEAEVQKRLSKWDQYLTQEENERKNVALKQLENTEDEQAQEVTAETTVDAVAARSEIAGEEC